MREDVKVFAASFEVLRWSGLTFTRIRKSKKGDFVAEDSKLHLLINVAVVCIFFYFFFLIPSERGREFLHPLHAKFLTLSVVAFFICGNLHNRKFVGILNLFQRVSREIERDFGDLGQRSHGRRALLFFFGYPTVMMGFTLWTDVHLERFFPVVHHFGLCCVTFFTAHFAITMNYVKGKFRYANAAFENVGGSRGVHGRKKLAVCLAAFLDLRASEGVLNEVFGKQTFLVLLLAFSNLVLSSYHFLVLNLKTKSRLWLNFTAWMGFIQSVTMVLLSVAAAESTAKEANKINEIIFKFPLHLQNWRMHNKVKYFAFFCYNHPVEFKAWIFYVINRESLFKVLLTSTAIMAVIIQCELLKGSFQVSK